MQEKHSINWARSLLLGGALLVFSLWLGWAFWFYEAGNFSDAAVSGTYSLQDGGEASILILRSNHTFSEKVDSQGEPSLAQGTWRIFGAGHIAFSKEFVKIPGQSVGGDGTAYGQIVNTFGSVSISVCPEQSCPKFQKGQAR